MAITPKCGHSGPSHSAGFTLLEALVVIAMMGIISAIMLPALSTAKERTRRTVCKNNIRQVLQVLDMYAGDAGDLLPSCGDDKGYYHSIVLSDATYTNLVDLAYGFSNILYCPNIGFDSIPTSSKQPQHIQNIGYVIGYSYLAESIVGSAKAPDYTALPVKWPSVGTSTNALLADANYWTPGSANNGYFPPQMKVAPHTATGMAMVVGPSLATVGVAGNSVASVGASGGNVGFADGHVQWRSLPQMQTNAASSLPNEAFGAW